MKRGNVDMERYGNRYIYGEHHVMMKAVVVMYLQGKEYHILPANHLKLGEKHKTGSPSHLKPTLLTS